MVILKVAAINLMTREPRLTSGSVSASSSHPAMRWKSDGYFHAAHTAADWLFVLIWSEQSGV